MKPVKHNSRLIKSNDELYQTQHSGLPKAGLFILSKYFYCFVLSVLFYFLQLEQIKVQ